jgi:hypothetical protein
MGHGTHDGAACCKSAKQYGIIVYPPEITSEV